MNNKLQDPLLGAKKWWGLIKQFYGNTIQTTVPSLLEGDCPVTDSKDKATLLNDYFSSQSILPNSDAPLPNLIEFQNGKTLSVVSTTENEVFGLLKSVDISKACGVDGTGNSLLKISAVGISSSLSRFFNISLAKGFFPTAWKLANVVPIFEKVKAFIFRVEHLLERVILLTRLNGVSNNKNILFNIKLLERTSGQGGVQYPMFSVCTLKNKQLLI